MYQLVMCFMEMASKKLSEAGYKISGEHHNLVLSTEHFPHSKVPYIVMVYPARSRWGAYRGCCSRRDGARTSDWCWYNWTVLSSVVGILGPFIIINNQWQSSCIQTWPWPYEILLQTATVSQVSDCYMRQTSHCLRDKHLARPLINKKK